MDVQFRLRTIAVTIPAQCLLLRQEDGLGIGLPQGAGRGQHDLARIGVLSHPIRDERGDLHRRLGSFDYVARLPGFHERFQPRGDGGPGCAR